MIDEKYGQLKRLMDTGKEKGFVLYDEVNELLPDEMVGGAELDQLLADLDTAGVEILEEPRLDFEKKIEEGEELAELELTTEFSEKTNDPVRMYLREMGTVPLLTREGEIELARRIERGQRSVLRALSRSALVIREVLRIGEELERDLVMMRDLLTLPDMAVSDDSLTTHKEELKRQIAEIAKQYKKSQQFRQKLQAISRE